MFNINLSIFRLHHLQPVGGSKMAGLGKSWCRFSENDNKIGIYHQLSLNAARAFCINTIKPSLQALF